MIDDLLIKRIGPMSYIEAIIAFDVKSWLDDKRNAVVYGIVFGLDEDTCKEMKDRYKFTDVYIKEIQRQHKLWEKICDSSDDY